MAKDAVATMGDFLPDDAGGRDAVHVAVFSAVSDERLFPGQHVAILGQGKHDVHVASKGELIGIADPFIMGGIPSGKRFWVYLYPRTITSLSHKWGHPAFDDNAGAYVPPATKLQSEEWLREFTRTGDCPSYGRLMEIITAMGNGQITSIDVEGGMTDDYDSWSADSEYLYTGGTDSHGDIPDEFWKHAENVIGKPLKLRPKYFTCSC
jgi:hypothetical protein